MSASQNPIRLRLCYAQPAWLTTTRSPSQRIPRRGNRRWQDARARDAAVTVKETNVTTEPTPKDKDG